MLPNTLLLLLAPYSVLPNLQPLSSQPEQFATPTNSILCHPMSVPIFLLLSVPLPHAPWLACVLLFEPISRPWLVTACFKIGTSQLGAEVQ